MIIYKVIEKMTNSKGKFKIQVKVKLRIKVVNFYKICKKANKVENKCQKNKDKFKIILRNLRWGIIRALINFSKIIQAKILVVILIIRVIYYSKMNKIKKIIMKNHKIEKNQLFIIDFIVLIVVLKQIPKVIRKVQSKIIPNKCIDRKINLKIITNKIKNIKT